MRVAVVEMTEPGFVNSTIVPVSTAIREAFPGYDVSILRVNSAMLETTVQGMRPDLIIAPAADFLRLVDSTGAHPIATRRTRWARDPSRSTGAAVVTLAEREDLSALATLRGTTIAATMPSSLDGWLALKGELVEAGFTPETFFANVRFFGFGMPNVIEAVLSGEYDAGVVPVCLLERIEAEGLVEPGVLKVIPKRVIKKNSANEDFIDSGLPELDCRATTALYPDLVIAAGGSANPEVVRAVAKAVLGIASDNLEYRWYPMSDFRSIRALEEKLHIGPWAYLEDYTMKGLWRRYHMWVIGLIALFGFLLITEIRLKRLVEQRTAQLRRSMAERERLLASEQAMKERIERLQRIGVVSQLCAIVAHELKQPIGAVINYLAIIRLKTSGMLAGMPGMPGAPAASPTPSSGADPMLTRAVEGAQAQIERVSAIVERVRQYAKRERSKPVPVDIVPILGSTAAGLRFTKNAPIQVMPSEIKHAVVLGDALEIELIIHNLLKNASEAVTGARQEGREPLVTASISKEENRVIVIIADNGPKLSDEAFERLSLVSGSNKPDGLGLGLGIVRNLAEENGGTLAFERSDPCGLVASVSFALLEETA